MTALAILVGLSVAVVVVVAMVRRHGTAPASEWVVYSLRFPRDVEPAGMQAFLGAVSGLLPPMWQRWWYTPSIALEVHADHRGIRHLLLAPQHLTPTIETALAAHLPGVTYEITPGHVRPELSVGVEYRLTARDRPLQADAAAASAQLLAALQPLGASEVVVVQMMIAPARATRPARVATPQERDGWFTLDDGVVATSEAATTLKKKQSSPLLLAAPRIGIRAGSARRAEQLTKRVEVAWRATRAPGVALRRRTRPSRAVARDVAMVGSPWNLWPAVFNTQELTALVGIPVAAGHLPGVNVGGCRPLPVPAAVPTGGAVIGDGTHPATRRPAGMDFEARRHHAVLVGPTGSGKSVLLSQLFLGDITGNQSAGVVLDPKDGELIDNIASRIPQRRLGDVVVFDPTDTRPVGFDPLKATDSTRELVVDRILGLMVDIWGTNVGPRSSDILRHLLLTISLDQKMTLVEAPRLLTDSSLRGRVLARVPDRHGVKAWWAWFDGLSGPERAAVTQAPLNKLRALVGRSPVAHTLGQTDPTLDLRQVLDRGRILLIRLPVGQLGEETTALVGALLVTQLWQAIAARADTNPRSRRPASVVLDEVGTILRFPAGSIEGLLTQARGYRVAVSLGLQHLKQLPPSVEQTVLTNARTKIVFAPSVRDARAFSAEFGGTPTPDELSELDPYQVAAGIFADGRTQLPATIQTRPLDPPLRPASEVFESSRRRWGQDRDAIDQAIADRAESSPAGSGPTIGRRRRGSG